MSKESGDFSDVVAELSGGRVKLRKEAKTVLFHYGDITNADDPCWFVASEETAFKIYQGLRAIFSRR